MAKNMDRFDFRYTSNEELWAPYRDKYPAPTDLEYELIRTFLKPFGFERDDFVETEEFRILQRELDIPDLRQTFIEFLHQVRESKGYDVKDCLPFFNSPFAPVKLSEKDDKETYDQAMEAAMVAINTINAETRERGKIYELVTVEKLVRTRTLMYLLTLAVKELDADVDRAVVKDRDADIVMANADSDAAALKTIRTMVYDKPKDGFQLLEWKFKY